MQTVVVKWSNAAYWIATGYRKTVSDFAEYTAKQYTMPLYSQDSIMDQKFTLTQLRNTSVL